MSRRTLLRVGLVVLLSINIVFLLTRYKEQFSHLQRSSVLGQLISKYLGISSVVDTQRLASNQTTSEKLFAEVNLWRLDQGWDTLQTDEVTCSAAGQIGLHDQPDNEELFEYCPDCTQAGVLQIANQADAKTLVEEIVYNGDKNILSTETYTHACVQETDGVFTMFFARYDPVPGVASNTQGTTQNKTTTKPMAQPSSTPKNFSEDQLWQALVDYRHAHRKPDLLRDENLCRYARKRVQEHVDMLASKPKAEYPNQDKYPLDAHAGFMRDGDTGELFDIAQKNVVAENLAYWPTAEYAHQVFEWGWDTSTEGHREAQLSEEYSHACISAKDGFYVAIFGK